ncbi:MAG: carboxypeptidase regulatory-like domain-containing protein [Anaerolineaceae bacterium]|nr:carboxypeptidase regulatory-like domain-containing protein [Anaerolineaceae bacterium]
MISLFLLLGLLTACIPGLSPTSAPSTTESLPTPPLAELIFNVEIPAGSAGGHAVLFDILDEVTGLAINPTRYSMEGVDADHFSLHIPIEVGSIIKYRYLREDSPPTIEHNAAGEEVRYRLYYVTGPATIEDLVCAWTDQPYQGSMGRISGKISDASGNPMPSAMVVAAGASAITAADGAFLLEHLPVGTHNVVAYSLDGTFLPYQQGAVIAENATTPAPLVVSTPKRVNVTFVASIPADTDPAATIRMVGDLYSLGDMFADLDGGLNTIASRSPALTRLESGRYAIMLNLPSGLSLRYKYSLGDGFWNAEHLQDGRFQTRTLIVPDHDATIEDVVESWRAGDNAPITFTVNAPADTPVNDSVSLQFNPYAWTEPIPMWPVGENTWRYVLYSPMHLFANVNYRYCRNDQCGVADNADTHGATQGWPLSTSTVPQDIQDTISRWANWQQIDVPPTVVSTQNTQRQADFTAGIEFSTRYYPTWQPYLGQTFDEIQSIQANWVFLSPDWMYTSTTPPVLQQVPAKTALWQDNLLMAQAARERGLDVAIYPAIQYNADSMQAWWQSGARDLGWWNSWFDQYKSFVLHHAELAARSNAAALVLGGPDVSPALPGGVLQDGSSSGVPETAQAYWQELIAEVRARFSGTLLWALPYPQGTEQPPAFLADVDKIYVLWSASLTSDPSTSPEDLAIQFSQQLDEKLYPLWESTQKPILLGLQYPSATGAATGCIALSGGCVPFTELDQPVDDLPITPDLQVQADIYNAAFVATNDKEWVTGIIARGFYPPAALQDLSSSIHGKPAWDVLWYWFPRLWSQGT